MEKVKLYNGVEIPSVGFGTFLIPDGSECVNAVKCAISSGYVHIDTASVYKNERSVGEAIRQSGVRREELFVTSKVYNDCRGYEKTLKSFEESLERLGMKYLDLFLIHWPANEVQYGDKANDVNADTWRALEKIYKDGKARAIGVSNFMAHRVENLMGRCEIRPMVDQIEYHPGFRQEGCVKYCQENGIVVEAWSSLGRGKALDNETLVEIGKKHGKSSAQVAIRWELQNGIVPLVKSVTHGRIKENIDVFDFKLDEQEMARINSLSLERIGTDPDTKTN